MARGKLFSDVHLASHARQEEILKKRFPSAVLSAASHSHRRIRNQTGNNETMRRINISLHKDGGRVSLQEVAHMSPALWFFPGG